jgi:hypothetical protein
LGRRCSRGRLGEDGRRGVVVHNDSVPALLLPPCVDVPEWPLLDSSFLNTGGAPVFSARRALLLSPRPPLSSSSLSSPGGGTGEWGKPQAVGGKPAGPRPRGVDARSRAARGQRCLSAGGLGARVMRARGRTSMAGGAPDVVFPGGKGVLSPWGLPQVSLREQRLGVRAGRGGAAVPSGARERGCARTRRRRRGKGMGKG